MRASVEVAAGLLLGLVVMWLGLVVVLWRRPANMTIRESARLLPDLLRMLRGLSGDRTLRPPVRWRIALLLGYLAFPVDLVPDFVPVIGYADDVILVALALRSVVRVAGPDALDRHWPGTEAGLAVVCRLAGADPGHGDDRAWRRQMGSSRDAHAGDTGPRDNEASP